MDNELLKTHYDDVTLSEKKIQQLTNDPVKKCPEGKEFNPITKRCNLKCKSGFQRDSSFKCKKMTRKRCPRGKEKNPFTKRCVIKCKPGYKRNKEFKCKKTLKKKQPQN